MLSAYGAVMATWWVTKTTVLCFSTFGGVLQAGKREVGDLVKIWKLDRLQAESEVPHELSSQRPGVARVVGAIFERMFNWNRVQEAPPAIKNVRTHPSDALVEDVLAHMGVHSAEHVIQENDVGIRVDRSRQADPLLLSPRKVDALFPDLRLVSAVQDLKVLRRNKTTRDENRTSDCCQFVYMYFGLSGCLFV